MTPFLLRPNESAAQLLNITVALAKLTVSSSSSYVNSDILISKSKKVKKRWAPTNEHNEQMDVSV